MGLNMMKYLKSRTVWTVLITLALNIVQTLEQSIPNDIYILVNGLLTTLAVYFRANPQVQ